MGDIEITRKKAGPKGADGRSGFVVVGLQGPGDPAAKIVLRARRRVIVLDASEVEWIDAAGNYIRFHAGGARHQVRGALKEIEQVLRSGRFVRVHRSTIVNIGSVREFVRTPYGDLIAVLHGGQRLAVGRLYRGNVEAVLQTRI